MELNLKSQRATFTESEKIKLSSSNKVHNFTSESLPPDAISLLNKGTNFIPKHLFSPKHCRIWSQRSPLFAYPQEKPHHQAQIIQNFQVASLLPSLPQADSSSLFITSRTITTSLQPSTMFIILFFFSLKNFYNLLNYVVLFILIYVTPTHTPHLTLQT